VTPLSSVGAELWFVLLLFALVSVPVFVGAVALVNRATGTRDEELDALKRRVEELESEREE
jgi:hypothetical protein